MSPSLLEYLISTGVAHPTPQASTAQPQENGRVCQAQLAEMLTNAGYSQSDEKPLEQEYILATYHVSGDSLTSHLFEEVPAELQPYQEDTALHEQLWRFVTDTVPYQYRQQVQFFLLFTDGLGGTLGAVEQADRPDAWMLELDIRDSSNFTDLSTTLVHEIAHLFTLGTTSQVVTDWAVFNAPDDQSAFDRGAAACDTYFISEGCSTSASYINQFFQRYWTGIFDQWVGINTETDQQVLENKLYDFYGQHVDEFVSDYAVTSPEEDIAESFLYFVFSPAPAGSTIAEEKILFFYEYPELVELRKQMIYGLCTHMP
jgi:hypothetical protein